MRGGRDRYKHKDTQARTGLPVASLLWMLVSMLPKPWMVSQASVRIISLCTPGRTVGLQSIPVQN